GVSFTIPVPALPPTAGPLAGVAPYGQAVSIDLATGIGGDYDSVQLVTAPSHGAVSLAGAVAVYTPTNGYWGQDSFSYSVTGPGGTSAPATVTVTVQAPAAP